MTSPSSTYLFIELSILVYLIGFGWEQWDLKELFSRSLGFSALGLAGLWFVLDQIALGLGLWTFPENGSLPIRLLSLPIEEYILFFLHTLVCFIFLKHYSKIVDK